MKTEMEQFATAVLSAMERFEERITAAVNSRIGKVDVRLANIEDRLTPIEQRLSRIEITVENIQEELDAGLKAIDSHAIQLFDHQKRIGRLEKRIA